MLVRIILACCALVVVTRFGAAADCQDLDQDGRAQVLRDAPSCDKAMELFGDCAYGATGDIALGQIVTGKCEAVFLPKLGQARRRIYARGIKHCDAKYANMDGSMYRAMAAGCRAELARDYAHKFGKSR